MPRIFDNIQAPLLPAEVRLPGVGDGNAVAASGVHFRLQSFTKMARDG